jgi:hypothetical protein
MTKENRYIGAVGNFKPKGAYDFETFLRNMMGIQTA